MRWSQDPLWGGVYDWTVEHERAGGLLWRLGAGSDLRLLHEAAREIGDLPDGAAVLDVPCGGGVALRGVRRGQRLRYVAADIAPRMLARTEEAARERGVADVVEVVTADVGALPFDDATFDLVASFTGLHCFPDPRRAVSEMVRVLRPGGVLTASALLNDLGLRWAPLREGGRLAGLVGPSATRAEVVAWLAEDGVRDVTVRTSGAVAYVRGVRA